MTTNVETNLTDMMEAHAAPNSASNRFTLEEKQVLFELFLENEDIIDIKQRKTCPKKHLSIRDCWNKITDEFNSHPNITTVRSLKQIQKFWLNARLRKSYPGYRNAANSTTSGSNENLRRPSTTESICSANNLKTTIIHTTANPANITAAAIKPPKLIRITSQQQKSADSHHYENIKFEKECEPEEIEMVAAEEEEEEDLTQEVEISTSSNDVNIAESESQQYSIDHISADKLTLNDLLEFKNGRSRDEIVLQIRTSDPLSAGATISNPKDSGNTQSYTTSYRIAHPVSQATIIQDHHYQPTQSQNQSQHINVTSQPVSQKIAHSPQTSMHSPNFYSSNNQNNCFRTYESIEDKINYYQLKEAELKYKEGQLKIEQMKIDLQRSKDELKNMKELHAYRIKEMEIKLKILTEEEKHLKITKK